MRITKDNIGLITGQCGAITRAQADLLKFRFPPYKGWKTDLVGHEVEEVNFMKVVKIREQREKKKQEREIIIPKRRKQRGRKREPTNTSRKRRTYKRRSGDKYYDKRWISVKKDILKRDKYTCVNCGVRNTRLAVHHLCYDKNLELWEVPSWYLVTLCERCHKGEHTKKLKGPPKVF